MPVCETIVPLDRLATQAWLDRGLPAMRQEVFRRLCEERDRIVDQARREGRSAYRWGYAVRRDLRTPWGNLGPLRVPRLRVEGREVRLLPRFVRRIERYNRFLAQTAVGGLGLRRAGMQAGRLCGAPASAATVGRAVDRLAEGVARLRSEPIDPQRYLAVVADGLWGRYRRRGDAVLGLAIGVEEGGRFAPLDWQADSVESADLYARLFTRLEARGLTAPLVVVGDGSGAIPAARRIVWPEARGQLCLWHWQRTLRATAPRGQVRAFVRDFWEVYNGLDLAEVLERADAFAARWRRAWPDGVRAFQQRLPQTLAYLDFDPAWRHRLRTVNLAEGFFRHFGTFFRRFPGFGGPRHLERALGVYLLARR